LDRPNKKPFTSIKKRLLITRDFDTLYAQDIVTSRIECY
jgi:hypothetical protein